MSRIVFDIETLGKNFESLDEPTREYLMKRAVTEEERQEVKSNLSLYPHTAEIITIGMLNPDTLKGVVYYQSPGSRPEPLEDNGIKYEVADEKGILENFWDVISRYDEFVTFNGRGFDCPFIIIRSAINKIRSEEHTSELQSH